MAQVNVSFLATDRYKNQNNNWENKLYDLWDEVNNLYDSENSELDGYFVPVGGYPVKGSVSLSQSDRDKIENGNLQTLEAKAEYEITEDIETDTVIVFDPDIYKNANHDASAQIGGGSGNHEADQIRVGICGDGGHSPKLVFHEILHTLDARHYNAKNVGYLTTTVMGPDSDLGGCDDGNFALPYNRTKNVSNPNQCGKYQSTETRVNNFIDDWL